MEWNVSKNCPISLGVGVGVGGYEEVWHEYCRKSKETPRPTRKVSMDFPQRARSDGFMFITADQRYYRRTVDLRMGTVQRTQSNQPLTRNLERDKETNG
ncbi:hypothetical protein EAF00_000218 [Botryotinia globosa]|nr:hypothetical protein EAF00_000218 [Botryotinia globosa]